MAYRQYIGARYVPLYVGDWDSTRNYEPLSIVTDGNGNSYTSLKDVPAGTQLNNRDYWILTSSFSGAIETLRNRLSEVESELSDLELNIARFETRIDNSLSDVEDSITDIENLITEIETNDRKVVCIGDSYGMRYATNWCSLFVSRFGAKTDARGGTGFTTNVNFEQQLDDLSATLTPEERANITDVVVCGGWNDGAMLKSGTKTISELQTAIFSFVNKARSLFPKCEVYIGFIGWQSYWNVQPNDNSFEALKQAELIYTCSPYAHLHVLGNCRYVMRCNTSMDDSYFHPNADGTLSLFYGIAVDWLGGKWDFYKQDRVPQTGLDVDGATVTGLNFDYVVNNDFVKVSTPAFTISKTQAAARALKLFYMPVPYMPLAMESNQLTIDRIWFRGSINGGPSQECYLYGIFDYEPANNRISVQALAPNNEEITSFSGMFKISSVYSLSNPT